MLKYFLLPLPPVRHVPSFHVKISSWERTDGNLGGPVNPYTGLSYGTSNFHWWLNNPYRTAGIPSGVNKDYRQTFACGAGPSRTYSFETHRIVGGITADRNAWPGIVKRDF